MVEKLSKTKKECNNTTSVYLVDYENVKRLDIELPRLCEGDTVYIFYSENCKNISLQVMQKLLDMKVNIESSYVAIGTRHALDFQLSSYLGYLIGIADNDNSKYYIVSKDKGFDCICNYWKSKGVSVGRINCLESEQDLTVRTDTDVEAEVTIMEIREVLDEEDMCEEVLKIFNQFKTKQAICNGMSKLYKDSKKASEVYKKLRPLLQKKKKK